MANERTPPQPIQPSQTLSSLDSRGVNSPFVERERGDADLIRVINGETIKRGEEQSSHPNNRSDGRRRGRTPKAGGPARDRELPVAPAPIPPTTENPFTASSNILETIAARFNAARELQKAGAWKQLQTDLMNASPSYDEDPRARCIDELQRISQDVRDDFLGDDWAENARKFYNVEGSVGKVPSFRPQVQIPQLQVLSISEATELTDVSPKVFIYDKGTGNVDQERSRAFQEEWKALWVNHHLMFSSLWAQFTGIGFLHFGYDPFADQGFGSIWCRHRAPDTLDWDPAAQCRYDATYVVAEDRLYPDQVAYYWPETGSGIQAEAISPGLGARQSPATVGTLPPKMRFP